MVNLNFPKPGGVFHRRYKILGVLGVGENSTVYQARDLQFPDARRLVAVKEFANPEELPSKQMPIIKAFHAEASRLTSLSHRALPKIFDHFDERGRMYVVMEYIHGSDLESLIGKTKQLPYEKIIEWAIDLCDVLNYLHSQSTPFIFRDLKPAHIVINSFGKIRLIDFAVMQRVASSLGQPTSIGTEGYAAPECAKGEMSPLTDIYSLGATLHHLVTRLDPRIKHPFNIYERSKREFNPQVSDALEAIVMKALAFDPAERYQSATEMKVALEALGYNKFPRS